MMMRALRLTPAAIVKASTEQKLFAAKVSFIVKRIKHINVASCELALSSLLPPRVLRVVFPLFVYIMKISVIAYGGTRESE